MEAATSQSSPLAEQCTIPDAHVWVRYVPDGAVSVTTEGSTLVLKASAVLQERFEALLEKHEVGALSVEETREYEAIRDLDTALSWLNRLARGSRNA